MTSCSPVSGGDAGLFPASSGAASLSHLAPAWSSPAAAAVPRHGHCSACQPERGACTLTPAAHLLPPGAQRDHRAEQSWGCSSHAGWCFPSPKVPAAYPGDGRLCWILSVTRSEKHDWLLRGLERYIKGDYPVPTHFCSDNICLLAQAGKLKRTFSLSHPCSEKLTGDGWFFFFRTTPENKPVKNREIM